MSSVDEFVELARAARKNGKLEEAAELYEFVAGKCEAAEAPRKAGHARRHAAELLMQAGKIGEAQAAIAWVVDLYRSEGDVPELEMANALRVQGLAAEKAGNLALGIDAWGEAGRLYKIEGVQAGVEEAMQRIAAMREGRAEIQAEVARPAVVNSREDLDALVAAPRYHTLILENEKVRVLDTNIPRGHKVPLHTHRWPMVHYVITWSDFVKRNRAGVVVFDSRNNGATDPGTVEWEDPMIAQTVENVGDGDLHVICVELKG